MSLLHAASYPDLRDTARISATQSSPNAQPSNQPSTRVIPPMPGTQQGLFVPWLQQPSAPTMANGGPTALAFPGQPSAASISTPSQPLPKCAIFWDFENCHPPAGMPGYVVVDNIRSVVHNFGHVVLFKAYLEINDSPTQRALRVLRSELQSSGVSLTDCPHNGRKDAADKMIMIDMLTFAIDNPPPATVVLISGDRDFVYALSTLRNRRYNIVLIVPNNGAPIILKSQANTILEWRYDVLNEDVWAMQQQQVVANSRMVSDLSPPDSSSTSHSIPGKSDLIQAESESNDSDQDSISNGLSVPNRSVQRTPPGLTAAIRLASTTAPSVNPAPQDNQQSLPLSISIHKPTSHLLREEDYVGFCYSPKAPGFFDLLVEVLETFRLAGEIQPRRSKVGNELVKRNPLLYHRAGCSSFKEYVELAEKEGLVSLGGEKGFAWIMLQDEYQGKAFAA